MSGAGSDLSLLSDAQAAGILFASDPHGLGGIMVRSRAGPQRDHFLAKVKALQPRGAPWRRLPAGVADERLDGALDLSATLALGRPVIARSLLAECDGGVLVVPMAERLAEPAAARLAAALDTGMLGATDPARFGLLMLDEGIDDEALSARLHDRLAFWTDLSDYDPGQPWPVGQGDGIVAVIARSESDAATQAGAGDLGRFAPLAVAVEPDGEAVAGGGPLVSRARNPSVPTSEPILRALAETAASLGIASASPLILALRVARASAALAGRDAVAPQDAALAARLVLAPRATQIPMSPQDDRMDQDAVSPPRDPAPPDATEGPEPALPETEPEPDLGDIVLSAAKAALPPGLLLRLQSADGRTARQAPGRAGAMQASSQRGRPTGVRRHAARGSTRLNVIETLRAAVPWQRLRKPASAQPEAGPRVAIRRDDFRFTRFKQRTETVTLFAVDASGSLAAHRLAEAKGAVELLLAECYVRRDQVALLAFRGHGTELLLPPTRSLARAKRCLAALAGGGGTPLAGAIDAATALAEQIRRQGRTPVIVFLTDGRANVARNGKTGRAAAEADAQSAATTAGASGIRMLVVDAAPRPQPPARALAAAMNATYVPLPRAEATALTAAIRTVTLN